MNGVLGHLRVLAGLVIIAVHLNLSTRIKRLESWRNHENLLINFDFLNRLIVAVLLLSLNNRIPNAHRVLQLCSRFHHFGVVHIDEVLLDRNKVCDKLLVGVALNALHPVNIYSEKVALLMMVHVVFLDEEIGQDFEDMWLEQRHDEESSVFGQSPDGLIKIRLTFLNGFLSHISSDGIKSTLIDYSIKTLILVLPLEIGDISEFVSERQVLWLTFLHLFDYSFLIINALDREVLQPQFGDELLREV